MTIEGVGRAAAPAGSRVGLCADLKRRSQRPALLKVAIEEALASSDIQIAENRSSAAPSGS